MLMMLDKIWMNLVYSEDITWSLDGSVSRGVVTSDSFEISGPYGQPPRGYGVG